MSRYYVWAVRLLLIPLGAFLVADIINQVIGNRLEASAKPLTKEVVPIYPAGKGRSDYRLIVEGNMFNAETRGEEAVLTDAPEEAVAEPPPPADLPLTLTGTVVAAGGGKDSFAVIQHRQTREQRLYRVGELVEGQAELIQVGPQEAVLRVGKSEMRLLLYEEEEGSQAGQARPVSRKVPQASASGVQQVTSNRWVLDRQEIDSALENLSRLLTKARVVPHFNQGKTDGFRIFSIVPDSFFSKIGLQNGDILQRINGIEVRDPQKFMMVFQQLKGEASITLDLMRNNRKQTFQYEIR